MTPPASPARPPSLIWPLQPLWGTHLTRQLARRCGLPHAEHDLYWGQPLKRLLSWVFAKRSGVWATGRPRDERTDVAPVLENALPVASGPWLSATKPSTSNRAPRRPTGCITCWTPSAWAMKDPERFNACVHQVLCLGDEGTRAHITAFKGIQRLQQGPQQTPRFQPH